MTRSLVHGKSASGGTQEWFTNTMKDEYRHKGARRRLVESLRAKGIQNEAVLAAIAAVPRHWFLDSAFETQAYEDKAFPIGKGQTISQPYTVAFQTQLLQAQKREKVLEVGTGSGYQAVILAALGARVFTLERQSMLYERSNALIQQLRINNIRSYLRDGYQGLPELAPFDKIIVTAAAPKVPEGLQEQLRVGGKMVVPIGEKTQEMYCIKRLSEHEFEAKVYGQFKFVPFLDGLEE